MLKFHVFLKLNNFNIYKKNSKNLFKYVLLVQNIRQNGISNLGFGKMDSANWDTA